MDKDYYTFKTKGGWTEIRHNDRTTTVIASSPYATAIGDNVNYINNSKGLQKILLPNGGAVVCSGSYRIYSSDSTVVFDGNGNLIEGPDPDDTGRIPDEGETVISKGNKEEKSGVFVLDKKRKIDENVQVIDLAKDDNTHGSIKRSDTQKDLIDEERIVEEQEALLRSISEEPIDIELPKIEEEPIIASDDNTKKLCAVCEEREIVTVFVPCGHAVSCIHCIHKTARAQYEKREQHTCSVCRNEYIMVLRINYCTT